MGIRAHSRPGESGGGRGRTRTRGKGSVRPESPARNCSSCARTQFWVRVVVGQNVTDPLGITKSATGSMSITKAAIENLNTTADTTDRTHRAL